MKSLLFLFVFGSLLSSFGQLNYQVGSVTLRNGNVITGSVADRKEGFRTELLNAVKIKIEGKRFTRKYKPREVSQYTIGNQTFVSIPVEKASSLFKTETVVSISGEYTFYGLVISGELSLLEYSFWDSDGGTLVSIPYLKKENDPRLIRATQGVFGLKRKNVSSFLQECQALVELIDSKRINTPFEVVNFYNEWVTKHTQ